MLEERVARIESDVEHLKVDVAEIKGKLNGLSDEFRAFKVEVTREFGAVHTDIESLRTAIEKNKLWMIVTVAVLISTGIGTLATLGRVMKWF